MQWLRKFEGSRLAIAGLVLAAVLFVAVNVLANNGSARLPGRSD